MGEVTIEYFLSLLSSEKIQWGGVISIIFSRLRIAEKKGRLPPLPGAGAAVVKPNIAVHAVSIHTPHDEMGDDFC